MDTVEREDPQCGFVERGGAGGIGRDRRSTVEK